MTRKHREVQAFRHISNGLKIFLSILLVMLCFEGLRHLVFPDIPVRASHIITLFLSSASATLVTCLFLRTGEKRIHERLQHERASLQQSQEALREEKKSLQALLNAIQESAFLMDLDGTILAGNETLAARFGIMHDELIGRSAFSLVPPEVAEQRRAFLEQAISSGRPIHFEDARNGQYIDNTIYPVPEEQGQVKRVAILGIDITKRKHTEQNLQQAKELAENANRIKGQFLSGMSHELRTPLNVIMGSSQNLMRDRQLSPQQHRTIHTIFHSGQCLLEMINDLLDMEKIETGQLRLQPNSFHSNDFFGSLVEIIRFQAEQKGLKFVYIQDPQLPTFLFADKQHLRRILLKLLSDTVKYSEKGRVSFKVLVKPQVETGRDMLYFQIEDTGKGIWPKERAATLEASQQSGESMAGGQAARLDLFVTQQLLKRMGSELCAQRLGNEGNIFSFEIELQNGVAPEFAPEEALRPDVSHLRSYEGSPRKVLLVDDNKHNRFMLREFLEPFGFALRDASSGQEAIRQHSDFHPDLILMDLVMPDMDGFETARRIRQTPEGRSVKMIAVSAGGAEQMEKQCLQEGFDAFLAKPVILNKLTSLLQTHLQLVWSAQEQAHTPANRAMSRKALALPPREDLHRLLRLARRGNPKEISDCLGTLEANDPGLADFVREFQELLEQYHIKRIHDTLMAYLGDEDA